MSDEQPRSAGPDLSRMLWNLACKPALWPVPALLVHAGVLATSSTVWTTRMVAASRSGSGRWVIAADQEITLAATLAVIYWLMLVPRVAELLQILPGGWGRTFSSEGEASVAVFCFRALVLLALYGSAWIYHSRFGG